MAATRGATPPGRVPEMLVASFVVAPPSWVDGAICRVVGSDKGWWAETWAPGEDGAEGAWEKGGCEVGEVFKAPPASEARLAAAGVPPSTLPPRPGSPSLAYSTGAARR